MPTRDFPEIYPSFYFADLQFPHAFRSGKPVWEALDSIPDVLITAGCYSSQSCVHKTAKIHPTAIISNSTISADCFIGEFVMIRDSLIGPGCTIGHCSEVARSIIMSETAVTHFCFVGDSVIGQKVIIGGGVRTANRRLDKGQIVIKVLEERIETGRTFLGIIAGDECQIGGGVHPNPGTLLSRRVYVMPGVELRGFIPPSSYVKSKREYVILPRADQDRLISLEFPDIYEENQLSTIGASESSDENS